jgi:hypothetical protein
MPAYTIQYEFNQEIAAQAADAFIRMPRQELDAKFWKGLVLFTAIGGLMVLLGTSLGLEWWLLLPPIVFMTAFCGLLAVLLSLHLFIWCVTCIFPLARWNARRLMMVDVPQRPRT